MKKFLVLTVSFVVAFTLLQILTGMFLTWIYTPDVREAWSMSAELSQKTVLTGSDSFLLTLLTAVLAVSIAYVITVKFAGNKKGNN